jgi:hypothetical protein
MRILSRAALVGAAAIALGALPAAAQQVTFSTIGSFSGAGCSAFVTPTPNTCTEAGGWTITFLNGGGNVLAPTGIDLGQFSVQCTLSSCSPPSSIAAGTTFNLMISQTNPTAGTASFTGSLSGVIGFNPDNSTLKWVTTSGTVTIGSTTYTLVTDNFSACTGITNCINIASPNSGPNPANPNTTTVKAFVVTPEPSTIALMATGIFGLVPVAVFRRRRR